MLKIRLSRGWKHKSPFYRIVLTERTKPVKSWYMKVLWWFDPLHHKTEMDIEAIKEWIGKGAQPSNRVAKLARKFSDDKFFDQYIVLNERVRKKRDGSDDVEEEETPTEEAAPAEEAPAEEEVKEETPAEPEAPAEEVKEEAPAEPETPTEETPAEEAAE